MNWDLIKYEKHKGQFNMDFDLQLVKNCKSDIAILRFYGWEPNTISIGANQSFNEIDFELTNKHGVDTVKRPTGGRAIFHAEELTYSVVMPNNHQISGKELYEDISNSLVFGMKLFHNKLHDVELEKSMPNFPNLLKESSGSLCFASTAKSEIKYRGKKIVGSAQRKLGPTILQHGSILIGQKHRQLADFIKADEEEKIKLKNELSEKTIEIETIINDSVNIIELQDCIIEGFKEILNANFITSNIYQ